MHASQCSLGGLYRLARKREGKKLPPLFQSSKMISSWDVSRSATQAPVVDCSWRLQVAVPQRLAPCLLKPALRRKPPALTYHRQRERFRKFKVCTRNQRVRFVEGKPPRSTSLPSGNSAEAKQTGMPVPGGGPPTERVAQCSASRTDRFRNAATLVRSNDGLKLRLASALLDLNSSKRRSECFCASTNVGRGGTMDRGADDGCCLRGTQGRQRAGNRCLS
jgi:hypothetical protein